MNRPPVTAVLALTMTLALSTVLPALAAGGGRDTDRDGLPDRYERVNGLDPRNPRDARADADGDRVRNLQEYRLRTELRDEDTDGDGHDDGDELQGAPATDPRDRDTDDDGVLDGNQDADGDGRAEEDEDDHLEPCRLEDDDVDRDFVADEDEDELGLDPTARDSDGDGSRDGEEDADGDVVANEDEDDTDGLDACDPFPGDDDSLEDRGDFLGEVISFDPESGILRIGTPDGGQIGASVVESTRIEVEVRRDPDRRAARRDDDLDGSTADLVPGTAVAEVRFDEFRIAVFTEIEVYGAAG